MNKWIQCGLLGPVLVLSGCVIDSTYYPTATTTRYYKPTYTTHYVYQPGYYGGPYWNDAYYYGYDDIGNVGYWGMYDSYRVY